MGLSKKEFASAPEGRLYLAAKNGDLEAVEAAVEAGAELDVQHPEFGQTPLIIACMNGHIEVAHFLLESEAELEFRNKFGWTALLASSSKGNLMVSGYLVSRGADVRAADHQGRTPLHNAVKCGCGQLIKGMIEEKADVHAKTKEGRTPLSIELGKRKDDRNGKEIEDILTEKMGLPFPSDHIRQMMGIKDKSYALLFPGQGSQYVGMLGWASDHEKAGPFLQKAKDILGYDIGEICEFGPAKMLERTDVAQPALFLAGICGLELLRELEGDSRVDSCQAVAGLSVGELTALCAAGCLDFEDGLKIARLRGEAMHKAASNSEEPQKMISVVGLPEDILMELCQQTAEEMGGVCEIANRLFPCAFAVSGTAATVDALKQKAKEAEAEKVSELKGCQAGFHTELMASAAEPLEEGLQALLKEKKLRSPRCTVYSSMSGERWLPETPPEMIAEGLVRGLTHSNCWEDTVRRMIDEGVEDLFEVGPMKQLKIMVRNIDYTVWKSMKSIEC